MTDRGDDPDQGHGDVVLCHDLDVWHRAVLEFGVLTVRRSDGRTSVASVTVKAVAFAMRSFMDGPARPAPGGNARPGDERLATELGISVRTVRYALARLIEVGLFVQTARGHTNQTATYAASLPSDVAIAEIDRGRLREDRIGPLEDTGEHAADRTQSKQEHAADRRQSGESVRQAAEEPAARRTQEPAAGRTPPPQLPPHDLHPDGGGCDQVLQDLLEAWPDRRQQIEARSERIRKLVGVALSRGWTATRVVNDLTTRSTDAVGHLGAVIAKTWLPDLLKGESPAERRAREDAEVAALPDDDPRKPTHLQPLEAPGRPAGPTVALDQAGEG